MTIELTLAISLSCTVFGALVGYAGHRRAVKREAAEEGQSTGVVLTEIGYIKSGIDDIKRKQSEQDKAYVEVISRLTAVEAAAKQAHKRIDGMAGQPYNRGEL